MSHVACLTPDISVLNQQLSDLTEPYSRSFILCDENTEKLCLPIVRDALADCAIIRIQSGEINKNLRTCEYIWERLTTEKADRQALLINLGGGVITDMGGFAASCYKRGIDFINIPTTLLAMVDASTGGKTGVDFMSFKNHIGLFREPEAVLICTEFLRTLDARQVRSGWAEIVKHFAIRYREGFFELGENSGFTSAPIDPFIIEQAIGIKEAFTKADPYDKDFRRALNFGHTIGHALESYYMNSDNALLHGEAVAMGMAVETLISLKKNRWMEEELMAVFVVMEENFEMRPIPDDAIEDIILLTGQDKKNKEGKVKMALIDQIGRYKIDVEVSDDEIREGIKEYNKKISE